MGCGRRDGCAPERRGWRGGKREARVWRMCGRGMRGGWRGRERVQRPS